MPRTTRPAPLVGAAALAALALVVSACSSSAPSRPASVAAPVQTPAPATAAPSVEPVEPSATPSVVPAPASPTAAPKPAAPSFDVAAVQRQLADLGYYLGKADGRQGPALRSAVMAFQKVQGLGADGAVGKATLAALAAPKKPVLKHSSPADRVEVDLTKQVLYVVKGGAVQRILPVSSGNGATYAQKDGSKAKALTPVGYYTIQRRIVGERKADLGTLYDPQYFYRGWAIHGSNSVPAGPASHGCVRVTRADAKWLLGAIRNGMGVYLYGGKHVFTAGSSAPGTDAPTGDGGAAPAPAPAQPTSAPAPTKAPTQPPASTPASQPPATQPPASSSPTATATPSPTATATPAG